MSEQALIYQSAIVGGCPAGTEARDRRVREVAMATGEWDAEEGWAKRGCEKKKLRIRTWGTMTL